MKKKIIVTGGKGRFANVLKKVNKKYKIYFPDKKDLNILNESSITKYIKKVKPDYLIHSAALSRPMKIHDDNIIKSININIIGTSNIVKVCSKFNLKIIYLSTTYVYSGVKGNYKETDSLLPFNNYAWSKLGGECAVQMYKNSLILRVIMSEKPFAHDYAFSDIKTNFLYHDEVAKIIPKIIDEFGVLNVGGKLQSIYEFAKKYKKNVKKSLGKNLYPPKISININKLKKIIETK
jgi:dTDP-4-dehydrorhamnose reductase|tara:strand:+ start:430 stop:1134 length:705 start_codon:yes stop_codon:yes gene_type:complete